MKEELAKIKWGSYFSPLPKVKVEVEVEVEKNRPVGQSSVTIHHSPFTKSAVQFTSLQRYESVSRGRF
jgi:hypothetical protein